MPIVVGDSGLVAVAGAALLVLAVTVRAQWLKRRIRSPAAGFARPDQPASPHGGGGQREGGEVVNPVAAASPSSGTEDLLPRRSTRIYKPLATVLSAINAGATDGDVPFRKRVRLESGEIDPLIALRRKWVLEAAERRVVVPLQLWIAYRLWVDSIICARSGRGASFHSFVYAHTLGLPYDAMQNLKTHWSGSDAADLLACLAQEGLLLPLGGGRLAAASAKTHRLSRAPTQNLTLDAIDDDDDDEDGAAAALRAWLTASLTAFNGRFHLAENRVFQGLEYESEGEWQGGYDFVQLADPQLGMLHRDRYWTEELTMLRLALQHVNRLVSVHISWLARVHMTQGSRAPYRTVHTVPFTSHDSWLTRTSATTAFGTARPSPSRPPPPHEQ
jgi:hypothetical protein